eukprot:10290234-Prorocentrum_lima.AAC.1
MATVQLQLVCTSYDTNQSSYPPRQGLRMDVTFLVLRLPLDALGWLKNQILREKSLPVHTYLTYLTLPLLYRL